MKFSLVINEQQKDGFKLSFNATTKEELTICKELTDKLISKITKIEVNVKNEDYDN